MISAEIVLDSISPRDVRLTTIHLRYPRMVHAELMTHRVFSRNGRSSRAVPVATLIRETPYVPHFKYNQSGMQPAEYLEDGVQQEAEAIWLEMVAACQAGVQKLSKLNGRGVHKQWSNRPLEWFGYIDVLVTSTEWANFFHLRDHQDAQDELKDLASEMKWVMDSSTPKLLLPGHWHLPYNMGEDLDLETAKKVSAARCARISYKPFDGNAAIEKELERYEKLVLSEPVHASPVEHQATPDHYAWGYVNPHLHGNFTGWIQNRKTIDNEAIWDR